MYLRQYTSADLDEVTRLMYLSVHAIPTDIYTLEQQEAWAPSSLLQEGLTINRGLVCIEDGKIVGFIELLFVELADNVGYINYLYVHPDYQHRGIATLLYNETENEGRNKYNLTEYIVKASLVAKPFFEKQGFGLIRENTIKRNNIALKNYTMIKKYSHYEPRA